ncbi:MAG TPA: MBL fold metallo-hydrolase [Thermoanaerobaculia bacterium]|nr:MBL fold metallo-hydrolase [Thermoanaerobaculia bacterium]
MADARHERPERPAEASLLDAPHGAPGRFWNPWKPMTVGLLDVLRWKLKGNPYGPRRPPEVPRVANDGSYLAAAGEPPSATWVGHATFAVQEGDAVFLTDPHWGPRALLPSRLTPPGLPLSAVPPHAFAVLSHNHYDHLDAWTVARLPPTVQWFVPRGLARWFRRRLPRTSPPAVELDWWQSARHGRFTLTCLPAQHWSNRLEVGRNATLWCSWLVDSGRRRYFFAGDTGYFAGFAEFGRRFAPIDVAMLPIGAYEPRWFMRYQHMDPPEAYQAFRDLGARFLLPMHWGVFDLTDEPVDLAPRDLDRVLAKEKADGDRVRILAVGERWKIPT